MPTREADPLVRQRVASVNPALRSNWHPPHPGPHWPWWLALAATALLLGLFQFVVRVSVRQGEARREAMAELASAVGRCAFQESPLMRTTCAARTRVAAASAVADPS